jgi:H+/Cl- antiporter ClcA
MSLTLLPTALLAIIGTLVLLGKHAGQTWAEEFRQSFRHTPLSQLAFWEWIGVVLAFAFVIGSVLLLPSRAEARKHSADWV